MSNEPFTEREDKAMHRLGVRDRDDMRSMRAELLTEGEDWTRRDGQRVWLTSDAVEKLAAHLAAFPAAVASITAAQKNARSSDPSGAEKPQPAPFADVGLPSPAAVPPPKKLRVVQNRLPNRQLLKCRDESGETVLVRVRDSAHFLPGSKAGEILARPVAGTAVWEFCGNPKNPAISPRCPRYPGQW
jgi:hypothetical protein